MKRILLFITMFSFVSCNTLNSVVKAKQDGKGTTKIYNIDKDNGWKIAKKSFRWAGTDAIEEYKDEGYMLTSSGMNLVSSGAVMGAWLKPIGDDKLEVTVISKRRVATQIATTMTEGKWHKYFEAAMNIVQSGQELPLTAPVVN